MQLGGRVRAQVERLAQNRQCLGMAAAVVQGAAQRQHSVGLSIGRKIVRLSVFEIARRDEIQRSPLGRFVVFLSLTGENLAEDIEGDTLIDQRRFGQGP